MPIFHSRARNGIIKFKINGAVFAVRIEKRFMEEALREARAAFFEGETPVGAVVVRGDGIVSRAHNEVMKYGDASRHAELTALRLAAEKLGTRYLDDCVLYVTMEPCPMCAGACLNFRLGAAAFGAYDETCGAFGTKADIGSGAFGAEIPVFGGIMEEECAKLLGEFFESKR